MNTQDTTEWQRANPYVLINVASIGTHCGRYTTLDEARREIAQRGAEYIGVSGTQVYFRAPVRC